MKSKSPAKFFLSSLIYNSASPVSRPNEKQGWKKFKQRSSNASLLHELDSHLVRRGDAEVDLRILELPLKAVQGADMEEVPEMGMRERGSVKPSRW